MSLIFQNTTDAMNDLAIGVGMMGREHVDPVTVLRKLGAYRVAAQAAVDRAAMMIARLEQMKGDEPLGS
jgi:hypothetical protein